MLRTLLGVAVLGGSFLTPGLLRACPMCREAVSKTSSAEENDQYREAQAYNNSIYLMVGMPYLMLGGLGFAVCRHLRQCARLEASLLAKLEGGSPCHLSPGETS